MAAPAEVLSLEILLDKLEQSKAAFLKDAHDKVLDQVSHTSRRELVSVIEIDGICTGRDRVHRPGIDSFVKVFGCFVAKKPYHGHRLDSAISNPVANTVSTSYCNHVAGRQVEIAEFFQKLLVEHKLLRTIILCFAADELVKKGVKKSRDHIIAVLAHSLTTHAAGTHIGLAIQHGVLTATTHVSAVVGGSAAAATGLLVCTLILKAVTTHITVTMAETVHTQALHGVATIVAKKVGLAAAAGLAVNFLASHIGAAGAAMLVHVFAAPLAAGVIGATLYRLPTSLGKKVAKGVQDALSGEFRSMTGQVLDTLAENVLSVEALGNAVVGEIVGMENWQQMFEGVSANPGLDSDMRRDIGNIDDIRKTLWTSQEKITEAVALYTFDEASGAKHGDLTFEKGDVIIITHKADKEADWWTGTLNGTTGTFPSNFVILRT